jgi:enoyl-CoA hydratase/carnithine racemase
VVVLTLNRPRQHNAWNSALESAYHDELLRADDDPEVRAIVVTGAGRSFCVGADLGDVGAATSGGGPQRPSSMERSLPHRVRKPLIAAINGAAAGLGLVQALYCDVRFCTPEAKLTTAFARRGLIAEYGIAALLPRLVGAGHAAELLLSGRVLRGEEAYQIGLVQRLAEPGDLLAAAISYARELATQCSPSSMRVIKEQLRRSMTQSWPEALAESDLLLAASLQHPDVTEGVASYLERRAPSFQPLPPRSDTDEL